MNAQPRACILSVSGPELGEDEARMLGDVQPWGVILMGRSCVSRDQVRTLVDTIWSALERACLIFIDQEGGRVARLKEPHWPKFPPPQAYADIYRQDKERGKQASWLGHRLMAHELASMSIHANCAPVLDRTIPGAHDIVGDRALGENAEEIGRLGREALRGMRDGGVAGVIKHIPGHGRALVDSHLELPTISAGDNELGEDFACFSALTDAPMAMTAHIAYTAIDAEKPATLSSTVINKIVRQRIGFDGLLMTDDLGMNALGGTLSERAKGALQAGCDVVLHCSGFVKEADQIVREMYEVGEASPRLEGKSLVRAQHAENFTTLTKPFDAEAGYARLSELLATRGAAA